ncbi:hypothetical protein [Cellulophaga baltica]|uniref:hypothetical protein n=1 Tax=Cellulophaga baltica TaxID=76594 RepID=UPI002494B16C|nr:hypothetical protein [Cellulophaga baltica]
MDNYKTSLQEKHRPPSRGGNTNAMHLHVITIGNEDYTLFAKGSKQWAFKDDLISFEYEEKEAFKNIINDTFVTIDKYGSSIVRGDREKKPKLRTAETRFPGSKRQNRD